MTNALVSAKPSLPAMSETAIAGIKRFENYVLELPQLPIVTHHLIHGGMYFRTIELKANTAITGVLIKIPTTLTITGDVVVSIGTDGRLELTGYNVLPGSAGRKQAFYAKSDVSMTMMFPTQAKTVAEAEAEFTDEAHLLISNENDNVITITGE